MPLLFHYFCYVKLTSYEGAYFSSRLLIEKFCPACKCSKCFCCCLVGKSAARESEGADFEPSACHYLKRSFRYFFTAVALHKWLATKLRVKFVMTEFSQIFRLESALNCRSFLIVNKNITHTAQLVVRR